MNSTIGSSPDAKDRSLPNGTTRANLSDFAGKPLTELRDEYRRDLFEEFLPFMERYVIDRRWGGFQCMLNEDGAHPSEDKSAWFQGRGIWVYSFLYNRFGKRPEYLEVARDAVELLMKSRPTQEDRRWPAKLSRAGEPLAAASPGVAPDMGIAEGLAEFSKASGKAEYWDLAKETVLKCKRDYDRPDYAPDAVAGYQGPKPFKFPGNRTQGISMLLFSIIGPMLETSADAELQVILDEAVDAVVNKLYNPAFQLNNEILNHDYSRPANALAQFVYTGHALETLGLLLREAKRTHNSALFQTAAERFRRHAEVAWDDVYGGAFRSLNHVGEMHWQTDKALWVQEEQMCACLYFAARSDAEWARRLYAATHDYVRSKFFLHRWGHNFWISAGDRMVTERPNLTRVEHYHHPRWLMFGLLDLDRLIERGGEVKESSS